MKLVIVESPAKCKTIQHYLGDEYQVMASYGHIRELATSGKDGFGLDIDNKFKPNYHVMKDKLKVINDLKNAKNRCSEVILATDPDREGEAIAWHLAEVLGLNIKTNKRLEFHEITKDSIENAIANPRTINLNLVSAQETRRVLDRIIGFKLSSILYKKIKSRSGGRVQSATLKIVYDNEKEIEAFVPVEYWNLHIKGSDGKNTYSLLYKKDIANKEEADAILNKIGSSAKVKEISKKIKKVESALPFTTSTLQQAAFAKYKFSTGKTALIAQSLYEGLPINGEQVGMITYIRTDSTRLSPMYISSSYNYIKEKFGENFVGKAKQKKDNGQDAHEAIRPTSNLRTPDSIKSFLTHDQYLLYKLIYERSLASLMAPKTLEVTTVKLDSNGVSLEFESVHTIFSSFEIISKSDEKDGEDYKISSLKVGDEIKIISAEGEQKFSEPPARYSEGKLVKKMEECGIGRPSTYAITLSTICKRDYCKTNKGILEITEQGYKTSHVLEKYFPDIVDTKYTASMEEDLDKVANGEKSYYDTISAFYFDFLNSFKDASSKMYEDEVKQVGICPKCGAPLVEKEGKNGKFVGCSNFPKCDYTVKEEKEIVYVDGICPDCGAPLVERTNKKGKKFIACSNYPKCKYIKKEEKKEISTSQVTEKICPDCGAPLVKKKGKHGYFLGCSNYPKCKHMEPIYKSHKRK